MRQLLVLRHAEAEDGGRKADFDRILTARGRRDATRVGDWLAQAGLVPDHAVSSPAPRALETAHLVAKAVGLRAGDVRRDPAIYDAAPAALLRLLGTLPPSAVRVLLVGHNPGLEQLALHLCGDEDLERLGLAPAGLVVLDLPDDWGDLGAKTASAWRVLRPDDLPSPPA